MAHQLEKGTALALSLLSLVGCMAEGRLVVQVRSDLTPQTELAHVEVVVSASEGVAERRFVAAASEHIDWGRGVRLVSTPLPAGVHRMRVTALGPSGATVVERPVSVEILGDRVQVVTVLLTRDCAGVECPLAGDDASHVACLAGRCVEEGCFEETPERCGEPACTAPSDCGAAPSASCASRECLASGSCFEMLDHGACDAEEVCSATSGCRPSSGGSLSPPSMGHAHIVALGGGTHTYRQELVAGAPTQSVSALFDTRFPVDGTTEEGSAGLSHDGEWMSLVTRRAGCTDCLLVGRVRDPASAELLETLESNGGTGTTITTEGHVVFVNPSDQLRVAMRDAGGWSLSPTVLSSASGYRYVSKPSLSVDDLRVLFLCGDDVDLVGDGICEVGIDGTGYRERLAPGTFGPDALIEQPREMADGGVVFQLNPAPGDVQAWRLPPGSSTPEMLMGGAENGQRHCVLPDGRLVAKEDSNLAVFAPGGGRLLSMTVDLPPDAFTFFVDACGL